MSFPKSTSVLKVDREALRIDLFQLKRCSRVKRMKGLDPKFGMRLDPPSSSQLHPSVLGTPWQCLKLRSIPWCFLITFSHSSKSTKTRSRSAVQGGITITDLWSSIIWRIGPLKSHSTFHHSSDCGETKSSSYPNHLIQFLKRCHLTKSSRSSRKSVDLLGLHMVLCFHKAKHLPKLIPSVGNNNGLGEEVGHQFRSRWMGGIPISIPQSLLKDEGS